MNKQDINAEQLLLDMQRNIDYAFEKGHQKAEREFVEWLKILSGTLNVNVIWYDKEIEKKIKELEKKQ